MGEETMRKKPKPLTHAKPNPVDQTQSEQFGHQVIQDQLQLQMELLSLQRLLIEKKVISEAELIAARAKTKSEAKDALRVMKNLGEPSIQ
jgi:hypothetical protein